MSLTASNCLKRLPLLISVLFPLGCTKPEATREAAEAPAKPESTQAAAVAPAEPDAAQDASVASVEQVDVLASEFEATAEAYYSQQFPDATDVLKVRPGLVKLATLKDNVSQQDVRAKEYDDLGLEIPNPIFQERLQANDAIVSYIEDGDTFAFREMFRLAACRVYVAKARFDQAKKVFNRANSPDEMASAKVECQGARGC